MKFNYEIYTNNQTDFKKFFIDNLERTYKNYKDNLSLIRENFNEKNVHDIRVSIRRLVIILDIAALFFSFPEIQSIRKNVKTQFDKLSKLRDIQVMSLTVLEMQIEFSQIITFLSHLRDKELELIAKNSHFFKKVPIKNIDSNFQNLSKSIKLAKLPSTLDFESGFEFISKKGQEIIDFSKSLREVDFPKIHNFRIRIKKFRYLIEGLKDLIPDSKAILKYLASEQGILGSIQDAEVLNTYFKKYLKSNPEIISAGRIIQKMTERKTALANQFISSEKLYDNILKFD